MQERKDSAYRIALCGLTARDSRLLEIVINRSQGGRHRFHAAQAEGLQAPHAALLDAASPLSAELFAELRRRWPQVIAVTLSDHGMAGDTRYRIARGSLLVQVMRVLEDLATHELTGNKVVAHPGVARATTVAAVPARAPAQAARIAGDTSAPPPLTALVVDDSLTVREQARHALERLGISCDLAGSAEEAMQLLEGQAYNLALIDVVMPGTDGYDLCRRIKQDSYRRMMPVLMLTTRASPFDRARGALSGCDQYLVKPITWDTFRDAVDRALMKHFRDNRQHMIARGYRA